MRWHIVVPELPFLFLSQAYIHCVTRKWELSGSESLILSQIRAWINKIWSPRLIYHLLECVHVNISREQTHQWTYSVHNCTVNAKHEYCIANICCQRKAYWSYCLMILIHGFLNYYRLKLPLIFKSQPEKNCLCDIWR